LSAQDLLSRLQKVKRMGPGRWAACCPAHADSSPSLNVKELDTGKLLVICRVGCSLEEIKEATGLPWSAFFEPKNYTEYRETKRAFPASDVLEALAFESLVVAVAASNIANGVELSTEDRARLMLAHQRITRARDMALGEH
jgi:hypothetical protein